MTKILTLGVTDLSFHRITGSLISHILGDMGFKIKIVYSAHEENFRKLKNGDVDLLASAWIPSSHGKYIEDVKTITKVIEFGLHYKPYALWGVPDYIPASDVSKISDLLKPNVLNKMNKDIYGINAGAGITRFSIEMMEKYNLSDNGYKFHVGDENSCFSAFENAVANKEWLIVPLWKPQFLHHKYKIREIIEPLGLLGVVDRAVLLIPEKNLRLFTEKDLKSISNIKFSNEIIAELDYKVSRENKNIDDVTRAFLLKNSII